MPLNPQIEVLDHVGRSHYRSMNRVRRAASVLLQDRVSCSIRCLSHLEPEGSEYPSELFGWRD